MIQGLNHITFAVSDLAASIHFYKHILGGKLEYQWQNGAYLTLGTLWLALNVDKNGPIKPSNHDSHIAFSVSEHVFECFKAHLISEGVISYRENHSEGKSFYFYDPDHYKLEIHVGSLASRLASLSK